MVVRCFVCCLAAVMLVACTSDGPAGGSMAGSEALVSTSPAPAMPSAITVGHLKPDYLNLARALTQKINAGLQLVDAATNGLDVGTFHLADRASAQQGFAVLAEAAELASGDPESGAATVDGAHIDMRDALIDFLRPGQAAFSDEMDSASIRTLVTFAHAIVAIGALLTAFRRWAAWIREAQN